MAEALNRLVELSHVPSCNDRCKDGTHWLLANPAGCVHHWVRTMWGDLRCAACHTVSGRIGDDDG